MSPDNQNTIAYTTTYKFHGGIHPEEHKTLSNQTPIIDLPAPPIVVLPLNQHSGAQSLPCVAVGDSVVTGQKIAEAKGNRSAHVHASASGTVVAIENRVIAHPSGQSDLCIVIETQDNNKQHFLPPINNPFTTSKQSLLDRIFESGIVGLGGAAFPSHIKLMPDVDRLIINAAECEPYITCDDRLMQDEAPQLIQAFELLRHIVSAKECIIGIEDNKPEAIAQLTSAIETSGLTTINICIVPTKYPSGGEKQLIELITGQQVPKGQLTTSLGLVMHNVATAFAIFEAVTLGKPLIDRVTTVTGLGCERRGNYRIRLGTPLQWILEQLGVPAEQKFTTIMGGPMMGFKVPNTAASVVKSTNCLIVAEPDELNEPSTALPCIRCGECADVCPANLLPQQLYWFARSDEFEKAENYNLFDCIECGACAYVCPSEIPLVHYYRYAKNEIVLRAKEKQQAAKARERFEFREFRLKREKAERAEKHRKAAEARKKAAEAKGQTNEKKATIAEAVARAKARKQKKQDDQSS
ncbi:electron transport complex subunit RsxC [Pleionea sediminis]|uniref:electron transport complex subunit RsxC n=1 Tax=Pleionea sediminis TaxID=2569479 RepID=UPI001186FF9E|nr:electron transport complex subunit RsxC [Pleionea sediminis]